MERGYDLMSRGLKILLAGLVALATLLAINTIVIGNQTKRADVVAPDGQILDLTVADLQVVDLPASSPDPDAGEGAPIVLLHCYACSLQWWDPLIPLLNENHRVIAIDLIGFGGSQKPAQGYSIPEQTAAVAEALNQLGVEGAVVVGHSMGGTIAVDLAATSSQLVDRVAVIGTPSSTDDASLPFVARLTYYPVLGEALWRLRTDGLVRGGYDDAFAPGFDPEAAFEDPDRVVEDNRAMTYTSYDRPPGEMEDHLDATSNADRITASAVPFLAILGAEDQIVDTPATATAFETVPGAQVEVIAGAGHSPNVETPEDTAGLLLPFAAEAVVPLPEPETEPEPVEKPKPKAKTGKKKQKGNANAKGKGKAGKKNRKGNKGQKGKDRRKKKRG